MLKKSLEWMTEEEPALAGIELAAIDEEEAEMVDAAEAMANC